MADRQLTQAALDLAAARAAHIAEKFRRRQTWEGDVREAAAQVIEAMKEAAKAAGEQV